MGRAVPAPRRYLILIQLSETGFNIVLFEPEIPANTGNIGRLCVGAGANLHIILPCRFLLTDKALKRAGLDYWQDLSLTVHKSMDELYAAIPRDRIFYCSTKAEKSYLDLDYKPNDAFVFGPESRGLPQELLDQNKERCITIPMYPKIRSLNLSNAVSIILYEAIRQTISDK